MSEPFETPPRLRPDDGDHYSQEPHQLGLDSAKEGRCRVLLVDSSDDNREVICTALRRRGIRTIDTSAPQQGLEWARQLAPDVIVLETEWEKGSAEEICRQYASASRSGSAKMLLLGTTKSFPIEKDQFTSHIAKPYHYAPLIRKIEELIAQVHCEPR